VHLPTFYLLQAQSCQPACSPTFMRVLVTGASGYCGQFVADALRKDGHEVTCAYHSAAAACETLGQAAPIELNLIDASSCERCLASARPDVIFNFAAISSPVQCEKEPQSSLAINCPAAFFAAVVASCSHALFVQVSTDQVSSFPSPPPHPNFAFPAPAQARRQCASSPSLQVFDGKKGSYEEGSDEVLRPVNAYGASKLAAEHAALALHRCVVLRLSLVYGPATPRGGNKTSTFLQFMDASLGNAAAAPLQLFSDEIRCPVAVADVCDACCRLVSLCSSGHDQLLPFLQQRIHCGGPAALSRVAMGETVCRVQGYSFSDRVVPVTRDVAMADAAFKFASPPDISMNGRLFAQLLQVSCRAAAHDRARLFIDAMPHAAWDASNATSRCDCTDTCSATSEAAD